MPTTVRKIACALFKSFILQPPLLNPRLGFSIYFFRAFLRGTFPPARRASDSPIAIACLRLVTFFPERPLLNVPRLRSRIAFLTFCDAFLPYLAIVAPFKLFVFTIDDRQFLSPNQRRTYYTPARGNYSPCHGIF
jgi:hypothetical protein